MSDLIVTSEDGTTAIVSPQQPVDVLVTGTLKGDKGDTGATGAKGDTGATGATGSQGIQGATGNTGAAGSNGVDGSKMYSGAGAPGTLHANGDYYMNTTNGDVYTQTSGSWGSPIANFKGSTGATGATGAAGTNGTNGTNGSVWYEGAGAPSGTHNNGDFYLNVTNGDVYQQAAGSWGSPVGNIKGATGATGSTGAAGSNGTNGALWFEGSGVPGSGTGSNGDFYLNTANGDVYTKAGGSWGSPITNLTGPAGAGSGDMILASTQTNTGKKTFNAGTLVDKGEAIFDVKGYGAVGNNSTDDTTAIQAALDAAHTAGGGIVFFPIGIYKITAALTIYPQQIIQGAGTKASIIRQYTNNTDALAGVDLIYTTIRDIGIDTNTGVTHTTNSAIKLTWSSNGNVEQIHVQDVWIGAGYFYGIYAQTLITSQLSNIEIFGCDIGFYFTGGGTSTLISSTYANACNVGYQLDGCVYMSFNGTACDSAKLAYYLNNCSGIAFSGCGAESPQHGGSAPNDGRMWYLTACVGVALYNCWTYLNSKYAFYASNSSSIFLSGFTENTPDTAGNAPTNAIYIHTDCARVTVLSANTTTANQLQSASTITTIISDNGGAVTFPGNMTLKGAFLGRFTINGANGNLMAQADTDGGEFNLFSDATGNLAIYGSSAAILHLNLLDGDFKTNSVVRLTNAGLLQNITSLNGFALDAAATASTIPTRDANASLTALNFLRGFASTATAAGTTTLGITDKPIQVWTGSAVQTIKLPTTGVAAGAQYLFINQSTGALTIQSSGANTIIIVAAGTSALLTAVVATPTTAANWDARYYGNVNASGKSLTANNTLTLAGTDGTTITFQGTDTYVGRTTTDTLTNKRVTKRLLATAGPGATPTINTDNYDEVNLTALAAAITSMTTNLTGTPVNGDELMIRFKDNGTARAITWGASFASSGVATLLATTVISKTHYVLLRWDSTTAKWICMAVDATGY